MTTQQREHRTAAHYHSQEINDKTQKKLSGGQAKSKQIFKPARS